MGRQHWLGMLIVFLGLGQIAFARPQPPPIQQRSHHLEGLAPDAKGLDSLDERIRRAGELHDVQNQFLDLLKDNNVLDQLKGKGYKLEDIEKVRKYLTQNPDQLLTNPALSGLLNQFQDASRFRNGLSAEQVESLTGMLEKFQKNLSSQGPGVANLLNPDNLRNPTGGNDPGTNSNSPTSPGGRASSLPESASGFDPTPSEDGRSFEDFLKRTLNSWAENLDTWDYNEESAALRDAIGQLSRTDFSRDGMNLNLGPWKERLDFLPQVGKIFSRETLGAIGRFPSFRGFRPPHLPNLHIPSVSPGRSFAPSMPSMPSAPSVSVGQAGTGLVWVAVAILVVVLAWKGRDWYHEALAARDEAGWHLGGWPIAPNGVTTRADLVRDFEYLALLSLGPAAGTRHHLDLADQLGRQGPDDSAARRQAAAQLASLYEQARYAPEVQADEPLPEPDRNVARKALCFLAGVAPA